MSDLLSASSLLMATVTILFSLWYGEIVSVLDKPKAKHAADNAGLLKEIRSVLLSKVFVLVLISLSSTLIFAPIAFNIAVESFVLLKKQGLPTFERYSAVNTAFSLVFIICAMILFYTLALSFRLFAKCQQLEKN